MKHKGLIITVIIFFILINTIKYWEGILGIWAFPLFLILVLYYLILIILIIRQIIFAIKEKFIYKERLIIIIASLIVLTLTYFKPQGIIDYDKLSGKDILVADHEGAANCHSVLKFKENNKFVDKSICFGVDEIKGSYYKKGDTLFFKDVTFRESEKRYDEFAVIKLFKANNGIYLGKLISYKNKKDTIGIAFDITKHSFNIKQ
ncbi:hypothetical protein FA048_00360 [Pedobacter polaris]|uniref:Uncharacterized protein n=1 Tax=Pedobacter polaris TaxID=2571273 RepID=A0A4U1CVA3_9SPHI|nr:hypothetical protein [Pedobacter polaris]TKC12105.1 hypothetical protein FA048_00360 [Pedobacter polaris]